MCKKEILDHDDNINLSTPSTLPFMNNNCRITSKGTVIARRNNSNSNNNSKPPTTDHYCQSPSSLLPSLLKKTEEDEESPKSSRASSLNYYNQPHRFRRFPSFSWILLLISLAVGTAFFLFFMILLSRYRFLQTASILTTTTTSTTITAFVSGGQQQQANCSSSAFASSTACKMSSTSTGGNSNVIGQQLLQPNLSLGLGTLDISPNQVQTAISSAISLGYKRVDCAPVYFNEMEIGDALSEEFTSGHVQREDLFIVSKLASSFHRREHVKIGLQKTLTDLKLDYLDLYLVHWPQAFNFVDIDPTKRGYDNEDIDDSANGANIETTVSIHETWEAMEELVDEGLVKSIGVSNFPVSLLHELMTKCRIPPAVNQVEAHPYLQQSKLLKYCQRRNVHFQAYSPLGSPGYKEETDPTLLDDPVLQKIAANHNATVAQICIAWALQRGTSVVVKSATPNNQRQNWDSISKAIKLSESDLKEIEKLERGYRFFRPEEWWEELGMAVFD